LHVKPHALHLLQRNRQASDHLVGRYVPLTFGLQGNEDATIVLGNGGATRPDIADRRGDRGVARSDLEDRLLPLLHPVGRDIRGCFADPHNNARVLLRKEALGDDDEQPPGRRHGREHHAKRDPAMSEGHDQSAIVDLHQPGEERFERARNAALLPTLPGRQQFRAEHGGERQRDKHRDQN
jgi:hypothetical protein